MIKPLRRQMPWRRWVLSLALALTFLPLPAHAQTPMPPLETLRILNSMTPAERVGQLFLVTFRGTDASATTDISQLVSKYHIGGVVLQAQNDNFTAAPTTLPETQALINSLQRLEWEASQASLNSEDIPIYLPLFVGISQEGDGYPTDQILSGLTPLPSQMAIGATWNPELARQVGEVQGGELSSLGFNFYLGPSLDVLEEPFTGGGDLGTRVFGGDPFWVGEMGRAFVSGLHTGSNGQLRVIARHFPGVGGSDRLPEQEISTVRKSLEQLKQIELAPFFAVTGAAPSPAATVDGLQVSHIRYQGFQGNIRATTRPISFDPQALSQILALPQFAAWQANGGLIISDDLSTQAVSEFYTSGGVYSARIAARDAFLAGNDMLYLGNILSSDYPDTFTTTIRTIEFFQQKYLEDDAFALRVDAAAARIITTKLGLFGSPPALARVLTPENNLPKAGTTQQVTFDIARNAATLISPDRLDLPNVMPLPPQANESMVFITDSVDTSQCSTCPTIPGMAVDALQQTILKLYGPLSGNQTVNFRLSSHTLQSLQPFLDGEESPYFEEDVKNANWIIISFTDASKGQPALISRFLRERPDLLRNRHVILFAFGPPYYFDTTTVSKLTAYYALYSKQPQFVEVAARLLFQELPPLGISPVSISAVGYDLIAAMSPDPTQIIPLILDLEPIIPGTSLPGTPIATPIPLFRIGDTIAIRTGVILDNNSHAVPDGTVVKFSMLLTGEGGGILNQVEAVTSQGVARAAFGLDKPGLLEIKVTSEPASISEVLQLDVSQSGEVAVTVVVPDLTEAASPTPQPPQVVITEDAYVSAQGRPRLPAWAFAMLVIVFSAALTQFIGATLINSRAALRWSLGVTVGGLLAYNLLALGWFGVSGYLQNGGLAWLMVFLLAGELLGLAAGWLWSKRLPEL